MIDYDIYIKSDKWKDQKKKRLKKDGYKCQDCGASNVPLDVHHITYTRFGNEDLFDIVTLCRLCHTNLHERNGDSKELNRLNSEPFYQINNTQCEYLEKLNASVSYVNDTDFDKHQIEIVIAKIRQHIDMQTYIAVHNHKGAIFVYPGKAKDAAVNSLSYLENYSICQIGHILRDGENKGKTCEY